ncbi:two-component response regulator BceR [Fictibacillus macauensis ZFHKF-1]|uniref:Two-component response regulator BceR n=1 Tax=Fictibacillus macauensis ZFHKF-1 TaxID=1196324 RepID=I8AHB5_9BACL|nr:response regulator transcription factor [Fictibacillus macauensis]EIT84834.1 two-component response regulator BceR [Fictibacillus macauensis ZFHKF-1]
MFTILVVEDDASLFRKLQERLSQWSYTVHGITNFERVYEEFKALQPDLVILDIQLPKYDGFHWCRMIRTHSTVPIIFLSSRDHPSDMIMSMQFGGDDFVQKPFHFDVLIAKVQATLRRIHDYSQEPATITRWAGANVEWERNTVSIENTTVELTKNEMFILKLLVQHKNKIVTRDELMNALWEDHRFVSDNTLTVNVNRLRKKLETLGLDHLIETKVGQGYIALEEER